VLLTLHRQENTDDVIRLKEIVSALNTIHHEYPVVLPLHPRTRKILERWGIETQFTPIEPVSYFDMLELLKHCKLVMTDSGGIQKEAYFFKKNCITLRDQTEWIELVEGGYNLLAGAREGEIVEAFRKMLETQNPFEESLYGDGDASGKIIRIINER